MQHGLTFTVELVGGHLVTHGANAAEGAGHVEAAESTLVGRGVALIDICTSRLPQHHFTFEIRV